MAVKPATWTEHWRGATGAVQRNPLAAEYTAVYRVQTDDPDDQAQTVLTWTQANKILLGSVYSYAGDTSLSIAVCNRLTADRELGSTDWWVVVAHYGTPDDDNDGEELDNQGQPVLNPLDFRPRVAMSTVTYTKAVDRARYIGGIERFNGNEDAIFPPMASNMQPFNPLPEKDEHRKVFQITRNVQIVEADAMDTNVVNLLGFDLEYSPSPGVTIHKRMDRWTAMLRDWRVAMRRANAVDFFEVSVALDWKKDTWVDEILDRGLHADGNDQEPDGKGGTYGGSDKYGNPRPPVPPGVPRIRRFIDDDGQPIDDPVLLDGKGQPLPLRPQPIKPVWGKWLFYDDQNIKLIGWPGIPRFFAGLIRGVN